MNLAINALSALQGGGQSYLLNLLRYAKNFPDIKIYVFSPPQFARLYDFPEVNVIPCITPSKNILYRVLWEKRKLPEIVKELEVDMVFSPGGIMNSSLNECLTIVTFQNMIIFETYERKRFSPLSYIRWRLKLLERASRNSFKTASLVIFLSDYAKKIIDKKVPDRKGLSIIIPHGLDDKFRTAERNDIPRLKFLPEDYLLYVSVLDFYKAQIEVIQAYHKLCQKRQTKEKLLLVGPEYAPYGKLVRKEIERFGLQDKVIITGQIPYADMPSVYHHAKAHIFASSCENCPNIVIESLGSGKPLFLSNKPPMPELAGDAVVYFDPYNPEELTNLLFRYLDDEQQMKEMGEKAYERSCHYSWEDAAEKTFQAFWDLYKIKS